jgi:hypothetical protein
VQEKRHREVREQFVAVTGAGDTICLTSPMGSTCGQEAEGRRERSGDLCLYWGSLKRPGRACLLGVISACWRM